MEVFIFRNSWTVAMSFLVHILVVTSYPYWTPRYDEDIIPTYQTSYSPNNLQNDEANSLFNSYGDIDPQHIQQYCNCVDMRECPAALSVFKIKPALKRELDLVRMFTCGYEGFHPQICCNLFVEAIIYKRNRKQKRAHYSYGGYGDQGGSNRYPVYDIEDTTNHHFFWDSSAFPHWSHAPTEQDSYDGHDCWSPHAYEKRRRGTTRRPARVTQPPSPPPTAAAPTTTAPTTTTPAPTTVAPVTAAPVTVVTTRSLIETTTAAPTGIEAKRNLLSEQCGTRIESRIVGGEEAKLGDYPWMARLGYRRNNQQNTLFRCGGTLLNDRYILTAAHCVTNLPIGLEFVVVRLGELDERTAVECAGAACADPPQDLLPAGVSVHPSYNTPRLSNDIALVTTNTPVRFTAYITPLCLPFEGSQEFIPDLTGTRAVVAGWGSTSSGSSGASGSPTLRWVRLPILPTEGCRETYRTRFNITVIDQQLCTGGIENMDACEGDSGGPLFLESEGNRRAVLVGIVSFGPRRCGTAAVPGVYTRVQSYLDWILENINI